MTEKEPREHGLIFGRGDDLGDDVEPPPTGPPRIPPPYAAPIPFGSPPEDEIELTGEIPWELQDEPPTGPIVH
jgi:hypothetical protein